MQTVRELKIDSDVPPPQGESNRAKLKALKVGDSFLFPRSKRNSMANTISIHFHGLTEKRFTISVENQPKGMARVWRIEDAVMEYAEGGSNESA